VEDAGVFVNVTCHSIYASEWYVFLDVGPRSWILVRRREIRIGHLNASKMRYHCSQPYGHFS
jgi:hypothetical protein